ncbi:IS66 family transposase [Roseomonas indoligenes]|uniref:IS66 family transposase n=1 Tax=Roseomonas indoligenes TaxID=2820811 RepID=UPI003D80A7DE
MTHVACWAHARRKLFEVQEATKSPIAAEAIARIGALYTIEAKLLGSPRRYRARPARHAASPFGKTLQYALSR